MSKVTRGPHNASMACSWAGSRPHQIRHGSTMLGNHSLICSKRSHVKTIRAHGSTVCSATAGFHTLPDGMKLETIVMEPSPSNASQDNPILLFVHGSYHGAWCWAELFQPYFSKLGYKSVAISLRGQGKSDRGDLNIAGTLMTHV